MTATSQNQQPVATQSKAIAKYENISEQVLNKIEKFHADGALTLPANYSVENHIGARCDYLCRCCFSRSGRSEKYHIRKSARIKHSSYYAILTKKMVLSDYIVKALRTYNICCF